MDNILKFSVDVNTATGQVALNSLAGTTARVGGEAVKAGGMFSNAFGSGLISNISHVTQAITNIGSMVGTATAKVGEFVTASNAQNMAFKGLSESARVFGQSQELANKYAKELAADGLVKVSSTAGTLKMLMASSFDISESMQLAKSFKDIGAFNNVVGNLEMAMYDVARGIKTGSVELIENIGFTQRLSSVMKQSGVDISAGIDITNNAAQRQALYNAIVAEGNKFQGNAAKLAKENAGAYSQLGVAMETAKAKIGDVLNVGLVPLAKVTTGLVQNGSAMTGVVSAVAIGITAALVPALIAGTAKMYALATAGSFATGGLSLLLGGLAVLTAGVIAYSSHTEEAKKATTDATVEFNTLRTTYENLAPKINKTKVEQELLKETIDKLKATYPDYLGNLNLEKGNLKEISLALDNVNNGLLAKMALQRAEKESEGARQKLLDSMLEEKELLKEQYALKSQLKKDPENLGLANQVERQNILINRNKAEQADLQTELKKTAEKYSQLNIEMLNNSAIAGNADRDVYLKSRNGAKAEADRIKAEADALKRLQLVDREIEAEKKKKAEAREKAAKEEQNFEDDRARNLLDIKLKAIEFNKKALEKAKEDQKTIISDLADTKLDGTKDYYETVKFADEKYIDWKKAQIVKELQEKGLTDDQIKSASAVLYADLTEQHKKYIEGKKKLDETFAMKAAKGFAESALSGMESEIDRVLNYKRRRTNAEYALDRKLSDSNYKASVKRIDDELKAEKRGSDRYKQLQLERQKIDADYAKSKKEIDDQQEADNLKGMEKVQAVLVAGIRSGIQAVASIAAAQMFKNIVANVTSFLDPTGMLTLARATAAAALTYTAVSAFGGLFEQGGRVPGGALAGASHKQGGIWINAEGGEYVFSKRAVAEIGIPVLDQLNFGSSLPVLRPKLPAYEDGGVVKYGFAGSSGMSEAKLDKMISLLEANNQIAYNKSTTPAIIVEQKHIDPKIVARTANKGNKDLAAKRRV